LIVDINHLPFILIKSYSLSLSVGKIAEKAVCGSIPVGKIVWRSAFFVNSSHSSLILSFNFCL